MTQRLVRRLSSLTAYPLPRRYRARDSLMPELCTARTWLYAAAVAVAAYLIAVGWLSL